MMVGVLLAAGASTRMGAPKTLVRQGGETFLAHGIRHLWGACNEVVVVLGPKADTVREHVEEEFERLLRAGRLHQDLRKADRHGAAGLEVRFAVNGTWKDGMYSSVRLGLKSALRSKPEGVLVLPVDHPAVKSRTVHDLAVVMRLALDACKSADERLHFSYALVPRYKRLRGHPVALSRALAHAVTKDAAADNLAEAVRRNARLIGYFDVGDPGVVRNRNTPRD
jgi:CTP:molybdopterin cytidylyltransferase MocA